MGSSFVCPNGLIIIIFLQIDSDRFSLIVPIQIDNRNLPNLPFLNIWGRFQFFDSANDSCGLIRFVFYTR